MVKREGERESERLGKWYFVLLGNRLPLLLATFLVKSPVLLLIIIISLFFRLIGLLLFFEKLLILAYFPYLSVNAETQTERCCLGIYGKVSVHFGVKSMRYEFWGEMV